MKSLSLQEFTQDYVSKYADFWYNSKAHHLNRSKQKEYIEQKFNKRKRVQFDINELSSESCSLSSEKEC